MDKTESVSLTERISHLFLTSKWHDIEFLCNERETGEIVSIKAHRLILATYSPVFEALCFGPLAEKSPVEVPDIEANVFRTMVKYVYTDILNVSSVDIATSLYYAGKKYLFDSICEMARTYLLQNLDESNCLELYNFAFTFGDDYLQAKAWSFICNHFHTVFKVASFENMTQNFIMRLVKESHLNCDEITLVLISVMWAREQCALSRIDPNGFNVRKVLCNSNIFQNIRWNYLCEDDLNLIMPGLLHDDEIESIKHPNENLSQCRNCSRLKPPPQYVYIRRYIENITSAMILPENLTISTTVTVNKTVSLHGIYICGRIPHVTYESRYRSAPLRYLELININILDDTSTAIVKSLEYKQDLEYGMQFLVTLESPVLFEAYKAYAINVNLIKNVSHYDFALRNNQSKIPSGLVVTFQETANISSSNNFVPSPGLSVITGLQFSW